MTLHRVSARSFGGGRGCYTRTVLALCLVGSCLLAPGCDVVANFGDFKFGTGDAGFDSGPDVTDSGPSNPPDSGPGDDGGDKSDTGITPMPDGSTMTCGATKETDCSDGKDNDCDMQIDCKDSDCKGAAACCKPTEIPEVTCTGGIDEDCDGKIDCQDSNCAASEFCCTPSGAEIGNSACSDGVDNDCDGLVDCEETACASQNVCCQQNGEEMDLSSCSDTLDNDCDGKVDCADPSCAVVPTCCQPDSASPTESDDASCSDGKDNDCDGVTDCRDSDCDEVDVCKLCSPTGDTETSCTDLIDNDCDKDRDCMDPDCAGDPACCVASGSENSPVACVDGKDNDCDGNVDCADPKCAPMLDCCVRSGDENTGAACTDGKDNDCDGQLDCMDPDCVNLATCCVRTGSETGTIACNDGMDNDCDGFKDCADSDCAGSASSCCVPTGSEAAQPNDGKDNDCNGEVDIPILNASYPPQGVVSSGREVAMTFAPSIVSGAALECVTRRTGTVPVPPGGNVFGPCPGTANTVNPFTDTASADAGNNGAWATDVRWKFPNGSHSQIFTLNYYIHHTLNKVKRCMTPISDVQWFNKALERLGEPKPPLFNPSDPSDTFVGTPFVHVTYQPPNANNIQLRFQQDGTKHKVDMWSLRRRFVISSDNRLLLIVRNYISTRSGLCYAAHFKTHDASYSNNNAMVEYSCEAIVLNRAGAGVCLYNKNGLPEFSRTSNDYYANQLGWLKAQKFMWRQLVELAGSNGGSIHADPWQPGRNYRNFTPKCSMLPCPHTSDIYLPDRSLFP